MGRKEFRVATQIAVLQPLDSMIKDTALKISLPAPKVERPVVLPAHTKRRLSEKTVRPQLSSLLFLYYKPVPGYLQGVFCLVFSSILFYNNTGVLKKEFVSAQHPQTLYDRKAAQK